MLKIPPFNKHVTKEKRKEMWKGGMRGGGLQFQKVGTVLGEDTQRMAGMKPGWQHGMSMGHGDGSLGGGAYEHDIYMGIGYMHMANIHMHKETYGVGM
jgi:hypothetical protein